MAVPMAATSVAQTAVMKVGYSDTMMAGLSVSSTADQTAGWKDDWKVDPKDEHWADSRDER